MTETFKQPTDWKSPDMQKRIKRRYRRERNFKYMGMGALAFAMLCLLTLVVSIFSTGMSAFQETRITLDINMENTDWQGNLEELDYAGLIRRSLQIKFPEVKKRRDVFAMMRLVSIGARAELRGALSDVAYLENNIITVEFTASSTIDMFAKGKISRHVAEDSRKISDQQIGWFDVLQAEGRVERSINWKFFTSGDSREPELAGILGATMGSFYTLLITFIVAFPLGVSAAIYLEEFAPKNRWTDFIEVNINNLAAVPSIVFGLLGLAIFLNLFGMPRSAPLVGGLTLALMTLPTIIIASRAAIRAVPPSIRDAAVGLGASPLQAAFHHVLPLSMPGILTGSIIGMAQALGETAPLLMIGMVAFIADIPGGVTEPAATLPVQIFLWADSPERGFMEKTSAAIIVLLSFLVIMNGIAIWLRQKFERNW